MSAFICFYHFEGINALEDEGTSRISQPSTLCKDSRFTEDSAPHRTIWRLDGGGRWKDGEALSRVKP
jgi:hypothetical protein